MSLNIFTKKQDIPKEMKFVDYNDLFFNSIPLKNDETSRTILSRIDKARFNSSNTFIGRDESLGSLNKVMLSTGCKTLLNIASNPDICFDVVECGQNALEVLPIIHNGNVFWRNPALFLIDDVECDICVDKKHFTKFSEVLKYLMD